MSSHASCRPAAAAQHHERPLGRGEELAQRAELAGAGLGLDRRGTAGRPRTVAVAFSMSSGSASTTGPGRPDIATVKARLTYSGMRSAESMLRGPLGERREHRGEVDFLERLAVAEVAAHVADEEDHRRRVLERRVHADARPAWRPGRASRSRCPAGRSSLPCASAMLAAPDFVAAGDELRSRAVLVQRVEHRQEALARHAEGGVRAVDQQLVDENAPAFPGSGHSCLTV